MCLGCLAILADWLPLSRRVWLAVLLLPFVVAAQSQTTDSLRQWGFSVSAMPGKVLAIDKYAKKWLHGDECFSVAAELNHVTLPSDSDNFASDYGYPTLSVGMRYAFNNAVTMRRYDDPAWGQLQAVDFHSHLGNTLSAYMSFARPLYRKHRWEAGYSLAFGVAYSHKKYNKNTSPDNEFIGSRWLIYFASSLYASWRFTDDMALKGAVEFYHHSNGALNRPNKGSNTVGPSLSLVYMPYAESLENAGGGASNAPFKKYLYLDFTLGVGGKVLNEDWLQTQFLTSPESPDYRRGRFHFYEAYSFQVDLMCRYARRWASGIGLDLFYGSYSDRVAEIDEAAGIDMRHSPWSFGLAAKHQVFYHNLSLAMSLGVYLSRHMGDNAKQIEAPYYERIGVHYAFPALHGLELGVNVKAHKTKADLTELVLSIPVRL